MSRAEAPNSPRARLARLVLGANCTEHPELVGAHSDLRAAPPSATASSPHSFQETIARPAPCADQFLTERRAAPRRTGNPIPVQVIDLVYPATAVSAWVVERSRDGVGLLVDEELAVGSLLSIHPVKGFRPREPIQLHVKQCHPERHSWRVGCQFATPLSSLRLHLFG